MEKLKKILEAEIAQRKLAMKHKPLNKAEIAQELDELKKGLEKLFGTPPQPSEIEKLMKEKFENQKIDDEFGWTGEYRLSAKDILDIIIDLKIVI